MALKLRFMGHLCPECGQACIVHGDRHGRLEFTADGWMGYYYYTCCYTCHLDYLLLFDYRRRFVAIVPNGHDENTVSLNSGTLYAAGRRERDIDEIPF